MVPEVSQAIAHGVSSTWNPAIASGSATHSVYTAPQLESRVPCPVSAESQRTVQMSEGRVLAHPRIYISKPINHTKQSTFRVHFTAHTFHEYSIDATTTAECKYRTVYAQPSVNIYAINIHTSQVI